MAGLTKDIFDRCYNDWLYHTDGLPVAFYIRAGLDGTATADTLGRFAHALRWRMVRPPLILKGDYQPDFENRSQSWAAVLPLVWKPVFFESQYF